MIDFTRQPSQKTEEEKAFDALNDEYTEKFGVPYVFAICIDETNWSDTLADIRRRIAENDPQPQPDYQPGNVY